MSHSPVEKADAPEGDYLAGWLAMTEMITNTMSISSSVKPDCGFFVFIGPFIADFGLSKRELIDER